jgi:hypothetical protein
MRKKKKRKKKLLLNFSFQTFGLTLLRGRYKRKKNQKKREKKSFISKGSSKVTTNNRS